VIGFPRIGSVTAEASFEPAQSALNVTPSNVVVPYAEFLEHRERRCRAAAELGRHDAQGTVEGPVGGAD
jgi:hypothetical protein